MRLVFFLALALFVYSCSSSSDTTDVQYSNPSQEGFRNSPFDTNGGIRNQSSFRSDSNRYNRPEYNSTLKKEFNYALRQGQEKDTLNSKTKQKSNKKHKKKPND
jgi:hypothetical protein